jgi:hypothetical protein
MSSVYLQQTTSFIKQVKLNDNSLHAVKESISVSIVSEYGLDDRAIGVRSSAEAADFSSSLCVQISSGAHPASYTIGDPFPGDKGRPERDTDPLHHLLPRSIISSYSPLPQAPQWR